MSNHNVPKTAYNMDDVVKTNPYDFKDELYHHFIELDRKERERLAKLLEENKKIL